MKPLHFTLYFLAVFLTASLGSLYGQQFPNINFTYSPAQPCAGQPITFLDSSTNLGPNPHFQYIFGDGNSTSSYSTFTTHTYALPDTYTVYYYVFDSLQSNNGGYASKTIIVRPGPCNGADLLEGYVFQDTNLNGTFDPLEVPVRGKIVNIGPYKVQTDSSGHYQIYLSAGTYSVSLANPSPYTVSTPSGGSYSFTMPGNTSQFTANFGLTTPHPIQDLCVTMGQHVPFRPGRWSSFLITVNNNGTVPTSGNVTFTYDDSLNFNGTNPPIATHDPAARAVSFSFTQLPPSQLLQYWVNVTIPQTVPLGTPITNVATVTPIITDSFPGNNIFSITDTVIASYDPNDKAVFPAGFIAPDQELTYRVRFQNTGTDTAFNIYLLDTLDPNLDLNTFTMLSASHDYTLEINQDVVRWQFDNILLPDSGTNEPESHGFVLFSIQPIGGLVDHTEINNYADIYFDFNAPVATNTVTSTILDLDSAAFSVTNTMIQGLPGTPDFETIYPQVSVIAKNVGIKANTQTLKYFLQLDAHPPQEIASSPQNVLPEQHAQADLTNFCIRTYYPGIPITSAFILASHTLTIYAEELGKANRVAIATFPMTVSTPLAVTLISFEGHAEGEMVQLNWATREEEDAGYFSVEKYEEELGEYKSIGQVNAKGSSQTLQQYTLNDETPLVGSNQYRLMEVGVDGSRSMIGDYVEVNYRPTLSRLAVARIFPNPAQTSTTLTLMVPQAGDLHITLFDLQGQEVLNETVAVDQGKVAIELASDKLAQGTYLFRLQLGEQVASGKLVKQ